MWRRSHPAPRRGQRARAGVGSPVALPSDCLPAETGHQGCPGAVPVTLCRPRVRTPAGQVDSSAITDDDPGRTAPPARREVLGRTHLGRLSPHQHAHQHHRKEHLRAGPRTGEADQQKIPGAPLRVSFAKIQRASRGPRPARPADRVVRLAHRQPRVAGHPLARGAGRRRRRPRRDPRGDLPDRGLQRLDVAVLLQPALRGRQGVPRGVQGQGHDLRGAAVRHGRVHEQHHRRDQEPDGVHGRLPDHDEQGHLRHQRDRARRRLPARPQPRRLLRQDPGQDVGQGRLQRQGHPQPRCVAGVRRRQARHRRRPHRPQAPPAGHRAAQGARLGRGPHPRALPVVAHGPGHAGEGPHRRAGRGPARHLPQAASGRAADA